jgi:hypothetical protein
MAGWIRQLVVALWRRKILLTLPEPRPSHNLVGIAVTLPSHLDSYNWANIHLVSKELLFAHCPDWTNLNLNRITITLTLFTKITSKFLFLRCPTHKKN